MEIGWKLVIYAVVLYLTIDKQPWARAKKSKCCEEADSMAGKTVLVTNACDGIGFDTSAKLLELGAKIIMGCRSEEECNTVTAFNVNDMVVCIDIDLNSFESIRDVVKKLENEANTITELDVLIHNDYALPKRFGKDTSKFTMMVNYYGPWLLTHLLMEKLKAAARIREKARIIIVSSNYHKYGRPTIKLDFLKPAFWKYFDAKSGLILFTMELDRRLKGSGVTVNAVHPGAANKPQLHNQTPIICLATTTQFATTSGNYFNECTVKSLSGYYSNLDRAEKFWTSTAKYVGLKDAENILPSNKGST